MKSNICKLSNDVASLSGILEETEKVASYLNLDKKLSSRMRLISEELVGMIPELLSYVKGEFWIESGEKAVEFHTLLTPDEALNAERREKLLSVSKSGKNAAAVGIMNKIKLAAEFLMIDYSEVANTIPHEYSFYSMGIPAALPITEAYTWSLDVYRKNSKEAKGEAWDELEKSIIANIADDVLVAVKGKSVEIIVKKEIKAQ